VPISEAKVVIVNETVKEISEFPGVMGTVM
jgi:hypothetical protein